MFFHRGHREEDTEYSGSEIIFDSSFPKWMDFTVKERKIKSSVGVTFIYKFNESMAVTFNLILGFVSSFFGTGGGFLRTPILVSVFSFPIKVAVATSIFSLSLLFQFY